MSANSFPSQESFERLRRLRALLLQLHKALLESERLEYENIFGPIRSRGEFFQLVIGHEWFDWLRPISQYIVQIDEATSSKEPMTLQAAKELLQEGRSLFNTIQTGEHSKERYYRAIQRDPDIASMHGEVTSLLKADEE